MSNMWINKARMYLRLNENCILKYKFSNRVVINPCLNLNELIYSCSWKLAVIDFLHTVGSPFDWSIWPLGWFFKLSDRRYLDVGSPFRSRGYWLISASRLSQMSVCRFRPEANLHFCLKSASRLLQMSDRRFPQKLL